MQPTILNKVVSLFLIGGISALGLLALVWRHFGPLVPPTDLTALLQLVGGNALAVIGGLLTISLAAVCGTACESLTDILIRPLVKAAAKSQLWSELLRQAGTFEYHRFWSDEFTRVLSSDPTYRDMHYKENLHGVAVGILYGSKQPESISWGESHYATYVMASNLALLSGGLFIYVLYLIKSDWCTLESGRAWLVIAFVLFYMFLSLSLDRYLYSYQTAMRQAVVALRQSRGDASSLATEIISTRQLSVRSPLPGDLDVLYERVFSDAEVMRFALGGRPLPRGEAGEFYENAFDHHSTGLKLGVLVEKATAEILGFSGLMECGALGEKDYEIGFVLARSAWHKGYATEIGRGQLEYGFNKIGCARLLALVHPENAGSIKVIKKIGMKKMDLELPAHEKRGPRHVYVVHRSKE